MRMKRQEEDKKQYEKTTNLLPVYLTRVND